MMTILCSNKLFFVYYKSNFKKCNTIHVQVTFKLVAQGDNLEKRIKSKFDTFFFLLPYYVF